MNDSRQATRPSDLGILIALTFLWLGLLLGISFVEAPLKFQAPGVTREIGLGIGVLVFGALNKIELIVAAATLIVLFRVRPQRMMWTFYLIVFLLLATQTFYLMPNLVERAEAIINGQSVPASPLHTFAIVAEGIKVLSLLSGGILATRMLNSKV